MRMRKHGQSTIFRWKRFIRCFLMGKCKNRDCLVNSRIGNGYGDYGSEGDNQLPTDDAGERLCETPATLNDTWGYKPFDQNWKSPEEVLAIKKHCNDRGTNYLLNIGPDYLGRFPAPACEILRKAGELL